MHTCKECRTIAAGLQGTIIIQMTRDHNSEAYIIHYFLLYIVAELFFIKRLYYFVLLPQAMNIINVHKAPYNCDMKSIIHTSLVLV